MEDAKMEHLLKLVSREPYEGPDYGKKRRILTLKLRKVLREFDCEGLHDILRGCSDQLLKYSSKAFEKIVDSIVATVKSYRSLDKSEEYRLRRRILLAVAETKYGSEELKDLRR